MNVPDRLPLLKRLVAIVLLLTFGLFSLEALIADVHDGDASAAEVANAPAAALAESGTAAETVDRSSEGNRDGVPVPMHDQHACHCVHAHGFSVNRIVPPPSPTGSQALAISHVARAPGQVDAVRHLRPPIA